MDFLCQLNFHLRKPRGPARLAVLFVGVSLLAGCDTRTVYITADETPRTGPPIALRTLDVTPGCYTAPPAQFTGANDAVGQLFAASRQMLEFQLGFMAQGIELAIQPIVDNPTARQWRIGTDEGYIEGEVLAEGTDWSVIHMVVYAMTGNDGEQSFAVTINVTPTMTEYDFGDRTVVIRDNVFIMNGYIRGCDPDSGISFEAGDLLGAMLPAELLILPNALCWPFDEDRLVDDPAAEEFRASFELQCMQLIASARFG